MDRTIGPAVASKWRLTTNVAGPEARPWGRAGAPRNNGRIETMKAWKIVLVVLFAVWAVPGCQMPGENLVGVLKDTGQALVTQIGAEGVLDKYTFDANAHMNNPGVEAESCICAKSALRMIGVDGDMATAASGTGTQLPTGLSQALIDQLSQPISDEQRAAILEILGWNRVPSEHNPPAVP